MLAVVLLRSYSFLNIIDNLQVALSYEDGRPVDGKGVGRKVIDKVHETYNSELAGKDFAYDGEKSLFTVGPLPRNKLEFTVVLEDITSNRYNYNCSSLWLNLLEYNQSNQTCQFVIISSCLIPTGTMETVVLMGMEVPIMETEKG